MDKYSALWVSFSSISDFLACPRAYFLKNVYKDSKTGNKISVTSPALALGQTVHQVLEALSVLPTDKRMSQPLMQQFHEAWENISGEKGGFFTTEEEAAYRSRGEAMIRRVMHHPGPLAKLAVKVSMELPHYWLSEEERIILCGKIDWLEYFPDEDAVHIIDFKTGKKKESSDSLQLPIYYLLTKNVQKRDVSKVSYWYLGVSDTPDEQPLPDADTAHERVLYVAKKVKLARSLEKYDCPSDGCFACRPFEQVLAGKAVYVGLNDFGQDLYVIEDGQQTQDSVIL